MRLLITLAMMVGLISPAYASKEEVQIPPAQYFIEMWNQDPEDRKRRMVFSNELLEVSPGDLIQFVATDRGHNVEFVYGPEGAELPSRSKIGDDVEVYLTEPGVYVYVCTPHATMGMIGVIIVGDVTEEDINSALKANVRGSSQKKLEDLLSNVLLK